MPIDANILLQGRVPDATRAISQGFNLGQNIKQAPMRNQLLESSVKGADLQNQSAQQKLTADQARFQLEDAAIDAIKIKELAKVDPMRAQVALAGRIKKITDRGGDPSDTIGVRELLSSGNIGAFNAELDAVINGAQRVGLLDQSGNAAYREFEAKASAAGLKPGTPEYERAAKVALGLEARAGTVTGEERIASDTDLTRQVARSKAEIKGAESGASEQAKSDVQLEMRPRIQAAVKEAETAAKARGETITDYARAKAALPGLQEVSQKLKTLADVSTYTIGGKAYDELVKQTGFGSTKGSTARAKMGSIIDNQVLPLLRDTFGSAFTAAEGDRLRDALMDPDATPEAKKAQLDAFIEQKMRNLEAQERELGINQAPAGNSFTSSSGIQFTVE